MTQNQALAAHKITVCCVLKTGGAYNWADVQALRAGIHHHWPGVSFKCLSDDPRADIPLKHDWPKWWSKIEAFRSGLFSGRVWYLDLDTLITGNLSVLEDCQATFAILRDFYRPKGFGSGVMTWKAGECDYLYERYKDNPVQLNGGDQAFIERNPPENTQLLQDLYPGIFTSWKVHGVTGRVISFHGKPKPWDIKYRQYLNQGLSPVWIKP